MNALRMLLACLALLAAGLASGATVRLDTPLPPDLFGRLEFIEDAQRSLALEQVISLPDSRYQALTPDNFKRQFTASAFWLRVTLANPGAQAQEWAVHHRLPFTDRVEYWVLSGGALRAHALGGDRTLMAERAVPYRYPAVRYASAPGETVQLYIRLNNEQAANVHLLFRLEPARKLLLDMSQDQLGLGALYGVPITLALMALAGWAATRDRRYVLYALYAACVLASWLGLNGQLAEYLFLDMPDLANDTLHLFFLLAIVFSAMFSRDFLGTRAVQPWSDRYLQCMIWSALAIIALRLCGVYTLVTQLTIAMLLLDAGTPLVGWLAYRRGLLYARWYMAAQLLYSAVMATLIFIGILRVRLYSYDVFILVECAFFGQLLLLMMAQYDRTHVLRRASAASDSRYRAELEEAVAERTRELEGALGRADRASRSKSEFLANMSHEIRTPINAIAGYTTLAARTGLTSRQAAYVDQIDGATRALLRVVDDLLDYSSIETGQMHLAHLPFSVGEVLDAMLARIRPQAERKGLSLIVTLDAGLPACLLGDAPRLGQVLVNLGNNAVKFTASGEIELKVQVQSGGADRVSLLFSLRDTGVGLAPEHAGELFDAFTQGDQSHTRKFGGAGLGLAICQRLVAMMEGRIWVDSRQGEGATFFVEITFDVADAPVADVVAALPPAPPQAQAAAGVGLPLQRFCEALAQVHAGLSLLAAAPPVDAVLPSPAPPDGDALKRELQPLLNDLVHCLRNGDTRADQLLAQLQQAGGAMPGLREIAAAVDALEYDAALALLEQGGWIMDACAPGAPSV
ncbi:MAG: ATP-binding protein [Pseudomonadota bacterium]